MNIWIVIDGRHDRDGYGSRDDSYEIVGCYTDQEEAESVRARREALHLGDNSYFVKVHEQTLVMPEAFGI